MSFISRFEAILTTIAERTYARADLKRPRRSDEVATFTYNLNHHDPISLWFPFRMTLHESNHEKLHKEAFKTEMRELIADLRNCIAQGLPVLDTPQLTFSINFRDPSKLGAPRLKLTLCGHGLSASAVTLATVIKQIETLERHIGALPRHTERSFLVADRAVHARDAYDALRVHMALSAPRTIDTPPNTYPSVQISEILDSRPLFQALFSQE